MSYFMTAAGPKIDLSNAHPVELVPATEAQDYVGEMSADLLATDGSPLFLVHDGESGTSHGLIVPAVNRVFSNKSAKSTLFATLCHALLAAGHTIRVWDAGTISRNDVLAMRLVEFSSPDEMLDAWAQQILHASGVRMRTRLTAASTPTRASAPRG